MNLYMFYVGGNAGKSNIEVHDIQFVAASAPEDAWPALREAWFGDSDKIHIDGYSRVTWADRFSISLSPEPPKPRRDYFSSMRAVTGRIHLPNCMNTIYSSPKMPARLKKKRCRRSSAMSNNSTRTI